MAHGQAVAKTSMNAWRLNGKQASSCQNEQECLNDIQSSSCQNEHVRMALDWHTSKQSSKRARTHGELE